MISSVTFGVPTVPTVPLKPLGSPGSPGCTNTPCPTAPRRLQPSVPAAAAPCSGPGGVPVPGHPAGVPRCARAEACQGHSPHQGRGGSPGDGQPLHNGPEVLSTVSPLQVSLKVEEEEAQHALQDATLVGSILARGLL